jgi:serine/threonine-protein kinase
MLAGEPPHTGNTAQAILGKIIAGDVAPVAKLRGSVPPNVEAAVARALEKLPADRFTTAQELADALADPGFRHGALSPGGAMATQGPWKRLALAAAVAAVGFAGLSAWLASRPLPPQPVSRYRISVPPYQGRFPIELSPRGDIVFADGVGAARRLFMRRRGEFDASPIPGTEGSGVAAAFAPDGQHVAYIGSASIVVSSLSGAAPRELVVPPEDRPANSGWALSWGPDDRIYYSAVDGLRRVAASGDESPERLTTAVNGDAHWHPEVLPGGGALLFTLRPAAEGNEASVIHAVELSTGRQVAVAEGVAARFAPSGHLVWITATGELLAAPFDPRELRLTGDAVSMARGVWMNDQGRVALSLSADGTLVYREGATTLRPEREFVWISRSGEVTEVHRGFTFGAPGGNYGWKISPEGGRVAFSDREGVWVKELPDGPTERIRLGDGQPFRPFWTPDGTHVSYVALSGDVWSSRADGVGEPALVLDAEERLANGVWSPDATWLVVRVSATDGDGRAIRDILAYRPGVDSAPRLLIGSPEFAEEAPDLSPDGRWLAYASDETGRHEVSVVPFPDVDSARIRVSVDGGNQPVWARSGRELFFFDAEGDLVAAQLDPDAGMRVVDQEILFPIPDDVHLNLSDELYDVDLDGQRFLFARELDGAGQGGTRDQLVVVENFFEELRARAGGN